jgi:MYXO-CTERM domain-containing protein
MTGNRTLPLSVSAFLLLIACALPGYSAPVIWQLHDLKFAGGGSASGSFAYDATIGKVLDWDITASVDGHPTFGNTVSIAFVNGPSESAKRVQGNTPFSDDFIFSHGATPETMGFLSLVTLRPLSDRGGIVSLVTGAPPVGGYLSCCESAIQTSVISGFLATAPEPGSVLFALIGIAAAAALSRRRTR